MKLKLAMLALCSALSGCAGHGHTIYLYYDFTDNRVHESGYDVKLFDELPHIIKSKLNYPKLPLYDPNPLGNGGELGMVKQILDSHFRYATDRQLYGKEDFWAPPTKMPRHGPYLYGDCEDYALLARAMLRHRGILSNLVRVRVSGFSSQHMILSVGDYVLDNRTRVVGRHGKQFYEYISYSGYELDAPWAKASILENKPLAGLNTLTSRKSP